MAKFRAAPAPLTFKDKVALLTAQGWERRTVQVGVQRFYEYRIQDRTGGRQATFVIPVDPQDREFAEQMFINKLFDDELPALFTALFRGIQKIEHNVWSVAADDNPYSDEVHAIMKELGVPHSE